MVMAGDKKGHVWTNRTWRALHSTLNLVGSRTDFLELHHNGIVGITEGILQIFITLPTHVGGVSWLLDVRNLGSCQLPRYR